MNIIQRFRLATPIRWHIVRTFCSLRNCWKCGEQLGNEIFCSSCKIIQPIPPVNLFEYIGIPQSFSVDESLLKKRFRDMQTAVHPDKYGQSSEREKELSDDHVRTLNKAFKTISEPLERAKYLIKLEGKKHSQKSDNVDPDILEKMMDWNEKIAKLESSRDLEAEDISVKNKIDQEMKYLSDVFASRDWPEVQATVVVLNYLYSLRATISRRIQKNFKM